MCSDQSSTAAVQGSGGVTIMIKNDGPLVKVRPMVYGG